MGSDVFLGGEIPQSVGFDEWLPPAPFRQLQLPKVYIKRADGEKLVQQNSSQLELVKVHKSKHERKADKSILRIIWKWSRSHKVETTGEQTFS